MAAWDLLLLINEVICHGIPNEEPLRDSDIINVDQTTIVDGWYGDQSETFVLGPASESTGRKPVRLFTSCDRRAQPGCTVSVSEMPLSRAHRRGFRSS